MKTIYNKIITERLLPIVGYENLFNISDTGKILSFAKHQNGNKPIERKQMIDNRGYLRVTLGKNSIKKTFKVHRLVALHFIPNPNEYKEVNHLDGDKHNNHYLNLQWATRKMNMKHAADNGLLPIMRGSKNGFSILKEEQVVYILKSKCTTKELAKKFNVSVYCIYDIKSGRSWKHISNQLLIALDNT
jgi:hypothetical protein